MKILLVSQYFWPENFRINDLAAGLAERGHEVTVLTGIPNYPDGRFFPGYGLFRKLRQEYCGMKVVRVPLIPRGKGGHCALVLNYLSFAITASLFIPFFSRGGLDLIFVYAPSPITVGLPAVVLKRITSLKIILWIQDLWPESLSATGAINSRFLLNCVRKMVKVIYRQCDRILIQSPSFFSSIVHHGANPERITYFPNSVENIYKPLEPQSASDGITSLPTGFRVMFAGNIGVAQDFGTILDAAERLKEYHDIHWIVLGKGRMYEWVNDQIKLRNLSGTVHLLGHYPPEKMPAFFAESDVMLVTLKRDPIFALTIPCKIQSYMACGRPIIAALDGEGSKLVVESGAGLASRAEDAGELSRAVLAMYRMPNEKRQSMGKCGREYYEANFEREMLIDKLESLMQQMSDERN